MASPQSHIFSSPAQTRDSEGVTAMPSNEDPARATPQAQAIPSTIAAWRLHRSREDTRRSITSVFRRFTV
jgi:hypothetical protein